MEKKMIKVQGITVAVAQPYAAGHTITEAEAKALNQVRAENIGNNKRKQISDLLDAAEGNIDAVAAQAQAIVAEYDATYEFTLASVGGGSSSLDPETKEARKIARAYIADKLREMGITQKEYLEKNGEDALRNKVAEFAENEAIRKAAREAIKAREKQAGAISDLAL